MLREKTAGIKVNQEKVEEGGSGMPSGVPKQETREKRCESVKKHWLRGKKRGEKKSGNGAGSILQIQWTQGGGASKKGRAVTLKPVEEVPRERPSVNQEKQKT